MLLNKKSTLKSHLSAKHPTFTHKVVAKTAHDQAFETDLKRVAPPGSDPPQMVEGRELVETRY
jgi:hypothetical protein